MKIRFIQATIAALAGLFLSACSSVNLWPFGGEKLQERAKAPANSTAYQCAGGKRFYVRNIEDGAVWVILPDREVRLNKTTDSRYSNGIAVLDIAAGEATLADGPASLKNCKAATAS